MTDTTKQEPKRKFVEKTGQNLWDIPALRRIFTDLKHKELEQAKHQPVRV